MFIEWCCSRNDQGQRSGGNSPNQNSIEIQTLAADRQRVVAEESLSLTVKGRMMTKGRRNVKGHFINLRM